MSGGFGFTECTETEENVCRAADGSIDNVTIVYIEGEDDESVKEFSEPS